jgi:hypothetical protein
MTRDPQLDAYLSAHRPAWGARQLATPTSSTEVPAQAPR